MTFTIFIRKPNAALSPAISVDAGTELEAMERSGHFESGTQAVLLCDETKRTVGFELRDKIWTILTEHTGKR